MLPNIFDVETVSWDNGNENASRMPLVAEEPLSIRIQGRPYSVIMRTPGDERAHAAGFCLGEGIVDRLSDFQSISRCEGEDSNVIAVTLTEERRQQIAEMMDRRGFVSQTSCGICGKEVIDDVRRFAGPLVDGSAVSIGGALEAMDHFNGLQELRKKTMATHAAAIYDTNLALLSVSEDVGRHNALDKAVGRLFLENTLPRAALVILSSRISYELVQKAARARIPIILAISRPTTLAVRLAKELNLTLACLSRDSDLYVFCGGQRLTA